MTVDPVNQWIVVTPKAESDKIGSLVIVRHGESPYRRGRIDAISSELPKECQHLRVGNEIVYDSLGAIGVQLDDKKVILVKAKEIVAVLRSDDPS